MPRQWTSEQQRLLEMGADGWPRLRRVAVSADAGAGKTSVLVERVRLLPAGSRVLCVSFTEKSKADLEQRLLDYPSVEVYTIHGFCAKIVTEFGPTELGLAPLMAIADQDESQELFDRAFEKTYRRIPPQSTQHGVDTFLKLCHKAHEIGPDIEIIDCADAASDVRLFVSEVLEEYRSMKQRQRVLEYADLERMASQLLGKASVREQVQGRYAHVFIDEFQDTNQMQCAFMERLSARAPLFVVGDEKQSIYRFRGADVATFRAFVSKLPAHERLSVNFRSTAEVISAVNSVCAPILPGYSLMQVGREGAAIGEAGLVQAETAAQGIAAVVKKLKDSGTPWSDIVLLLRRMRGNEKLFEELKAHGIRVAAASRGSVAADDGLSALVNLWIWSAEPWQRLRAAQAFADFGDSQINKENLDALAPLSLPGERLGCEELLERIEARFRAGAECGAVWEQFKLFVLKHQSQGLSPGALARRLDRLLSNGEDISGFTLLPPPANLSGSIRAMTVHGSKGLEFPVVILADLENRRARSETTVVSGNTLWLPARNEDGTLDKDRPEIKEALERNQGAERQERARLLYVAMTRAEDALYAVDVAPPEPKAPSKSKAQQESWASWLRAGLVRCDIGEPSLDVEKQAAHSAEASQLASVGRSGGARLPLGPAPAYVRARIGVSDFIGPGLKAASKPKFSGDFDPRAAGELVHSCLERQDWDGLKAAAMGYGLDLAAFERWRATDQGCIAFGARGSRFPEFEFEWKTAQGVIVGRMDLVVHDGDEAWVYDYKTLFGPHSRLEVIERYRDQIMVYARAVKGLTRARRVHAALLDVAGATGDVHLPIDSI